MIPLITLEEHYSSPKVAESSSEARNHYAHFPSHVLSKLEGLGDDRIHDMDKGSVSLKSFRMALATYLQASAQQPTTI